MISQLQYAAVSSDKLDPIQKKASHKAKTYSNYNHEN